MTALSPPGTVGGELELLGSHILEDLLVEHRDVRGAVLGALRTLLEEGLVVKTAKGVYGAA